jgi:carboxyl-terminal processing protease
MRTGIDAMMNSLDPYTVYYSESQVESYRISTEGTYSGLGAQSMNVDGFFTVAEIYKDGPADKGGLKVGDQVIAVNGKSSEGKSYDDVLQIIRGFPGTDVTLTVKRPVTNEEKNIVITRSDVDIPNVPYSGFVSEDVGYVALSTFTRFAGKNIASALRGMQEQNPEMKGLILDLRGNGGGLLSEAVDILGIFLPRESLVVTTKGKVRDRDRFYRTDRYPIDTELPIIVLTDDNSASASEIVSGAIQDYDRGIIIGQRTYGKGLVQNHREVGYNSRIKVTTAKYYIPSGRCIQSREYQDGEPKIISDDQRAVFFTSNKRQVLDGGGVAPDVTLEAPEDPALISYLKRNNLLFKYVTEYLANYQHPDTIVNLKYDDYGNFIEYLKKIGLEYTTSSEEMMTKLNETVIKEGYGDILQSELQNIQSKIDKEKEDDLQQYKAEIVSMIEEDLAQRIFFQEGKARQRLKNDSEINEAVELLGNKEKYLNLLQPKK